MGAKQISLSKGKKIPRILLIVVAFVLTVPLLSLVVNTSSSYAACPTGQSPGVTGTPQSDPTQCYTPDSNTPTGSPSGINSSGTPVNGTAATDINSNSNSSTNCAVEKLGWILCPIIETSAKISDKTFDILANNFLRTDPQLVSNGSGTKVAWEVARNIANVMFIITFLAIIISQVTGAGITNYGVKKMIPRLIVAAIAVNVSYYACQLIVDLTNIFGYEIYNALISIANTIGPSVFGSASAHGVSQTGNAVTGTILTVIAGAALAVAGAVWVTLPMLISVVLFVLITVATIIIILLLRKALIVLLVVISPIAFVM